MKKIIAVIGLILIAAGGVFYYQNKQTVPSDLIGKSLTTSQSVSDNKLGGQYSLCFEKNKAYLVAMTSVAKVDTATAKQFRQVIDEKGNMLTAGQKADLGRAEVSKQKGKLIVKTKKLTVNFTIKRDGSYYTADGTMWLLAKQD